LVELKLDDIALIYRAQAQPTDPITELREVRDIRTMDHRNVVELRIPGADGNVLQEMGREPVGILFTGQVWGPHAKTTIQALLDKYESQKPSPFSSDITALADVNNVVIEDLVLETTAGKADYYVYHIALKEYKEPKPTKQQGQPPAQKPEKKDSDIQDIRGRLLDGEGNPAVNVIVSIKGKPGEYTATTDDDGFYEAEGLPEGDYTVTSEAQGYEDFHAEVEVRKKTE
jgi:Carboxypeptidase regulatory-like domain